MLDHPLSLPPGLPVPKDDGAAWHLRGQALPALSLARASGGEASLASLCTRPTVLFFYPRTGIPGQAPNRGFRGEDWESIPGARGCTPQACGFRDLSTDFAALGVQVFGVSTNTIEHQREFRARTATPIDFLSDADLRLTRAMSLPTFDFPVESGGPNTLLRRMAWYVDPDGSGTPRIRKVWYPVFPPDENAPRVLAWLRVRRAIRVRPVAPADRDAVRALMDRFFAGPIIHSLGHRYDTLDLPGSIAESAGQPIGVVLLTRRGNLTEVIALAAADSGRGVGSALLDAAEDDARAGGSTHLMLTTSNDNLDALGFYQRRGMRITAVHPGLIEACRAEKPGLTFIGHHGVPQRDEIELTLDLNPRPEPVTRS